jgi:hypothetical protein
MGGLQARQGGRVGDLDDRGVRLRKSAELECLDEQA